MHELNSLRDARDALDDQVQRMEWGLGPRPSPCGPQPTPVLTQNNLRSRPFPPTSTDSSSSSNNRSNGSSGFRSAGSLQGSDNAIESSTDHAQEVLVSSWDSGNAEASSSALDSTDHSSSSSSSSSGSSLDADDVELAGYREALNNLRQQRDAVSTLRSSI